MVRVIGIFFNHRHNLGFRNEAREIVNMAVGVVAFDSVAKPENLFYPEKVAKPFLNFVAGEIRIPILIEQTRLAREQRACAVHFN